MWEAVSGRKTQEDCSQADFLHVLSNFYFVLWWHHIVCTRDRSQSWLKHAQARIKKDNRREQSEKLSKLLIVGSWVPDIS